MSKRKLSPTETKEPKKYKSQPNEIVHPADILVLNDEVYVVDYGANKIRVYDLEGNFLRKWGKYGKDNGEFDDPIEIATNGKEIFVLDRGRVQLFDTEGNYLKKIILKSNGDRLHIAGDQIIINNDPYCKERVITIYDIDGNVLTEWSYGNGGGFDFGFGSYFSGIELWNEELYISDAETIHVYKLCGKLDRTIKLDSPVYIFGHDKIKIHNSEIYVAVNNNDRIYVFDLNGKYLRKINNNGTYFAETLRKPSSFAFGDMLSYDMLANFAVHGNKLIASKPKFNKMEILDIGSI